MLDAIGLGKARSLLMLARTSSALKWTAFKRGART
jgi:hypothetical protein